MKFKNEKILKSGRKAAYVFENGKWKWKILKKTAGATSMSEQDYLIRINDKLKTNTKLQMDDAGIEFKTI